MNGLLLQSPVEALRYAVGLGLLHEGEGGRKARETDLPQEVIGQVLGAVVHAQGDAAGNVPADGSEDTLDRHANGLERVETVADFVDVSVHALAVPVLDDSENPDPIVIDRKDHVLSVPHTTFVASVMM